TRAVLRGCGPTRWSGPPPAAPCSRWTRRRRWGRRWSPPAPVADRRSVRSPGRPPRSRAARGRDRAPDPGRLRAPRASRARAGRRASGRDLVGGRLDAPVVVGVAASVRPGVAAVTRPVGLHHVPLLGRHADELLEATGEVLG